MKNETNIREEIMDGAAGEALGAHSPADSSAYADALQGGSPEEKRLDLEMRETVARMAGAAPFMNPSEDLRGRILQATAPASFKMEDYIRANRDTGRFFKWGFFAAMAFLAAGAWYNISMRQDMATMQNRAAGLASMVQDRNAVLNNMVNPDAEQITLMNKDKISGKAFLNPVTKTAVVVLPEGLLAANVRPVISVPDKNGKMQQLNTLYVSAPREAFPNIGDVQPMTDFALNHVQPDTKTKVYTAGFGN